ncbi:MAG: sugar ABC transporter substrate-binding protein [Clostridiales bacterium]|nr:sugar ABC transporter substrate-binding protein [Clostridiales bacterium]
MKKLLSTILTVSFILSCAACSKSEETTKMKKKVKKTTKTEVSEDPTEVPSEPSVDPTDSDPTSSTNSRGGVTNPSAYTTFTMFICTPGNEINDDNDVQTLIADLTGCMVKETYLIGQTETDAIGSILASGILPDLFYANDSAYDLYQSETLIPWDTYLADPAYSNLRSLFTDAQWELFRQSDGHIYWADVFASQNGENQKNTFEEPAFWIQTRVLEWAGYPLITTLDEYFALIESYYAEHKTNADGTDIIPFTSITEGWRNFALRLPPLLLDGYSDTYPLGVDTTDPDNPQVFDYNTSETAKAYYKKLNECYKNGLIDQDFGVMDYEEYASKLSTGAVLGMFDAYWDFCYCTNEFFSTAGMGGLGYEYVPLGLTIDSGMENHYFSGRSTIKTLSGVCVSTSCKDPDLLFTFLNRILDQDIHDLRFWGVEQEDYLIDDTTGLYYRTPAMVSASQDYSYQAAHLCPYSYLPQFSGTSRDGINAMKSADQPSVFVTNCPESIQKYFLAYGYDSYCDSLRSSETEWEPWEPISTFTNSLDTTTAGGVTYLRITELQTEYLPQLVRADDFDAVWDEYMTEYKNLDRDALVAETQQYVDTMEALVG